MDLTEWMRGHSWALAPAFIVVLAAIVWMRTRLAGKIEIKPVDVGIALTPVCRRLIYRCRRPVS